MLALKFVCVPLLFVLLYLLQWPPFFLSISLFFCIYSYAFFLSIFLYVLLYLLQCLCSFYLYVLLYLLQCLRSFYLYVLLYLLNWPSIFLYVILCLLQCLLSNYLSISLFFSTYFFLSTSCSSVSILMPSFFLSINHSLLLSIYLFVLLYLLQCIICVPLSLSFLSANLFFWGGTTFVMSHLTIVAGTRKSRQLQNTLLSLSIPLSVSTLSLSLSLSFSHLSLCHTLTYACVHPYTKTDRHIFCVIKTQPS